ncbi:succinylglutamate desuccinylase [Vibrio sp. AND4]|nr:succinylglutamate desuccinylase [Vibrio sp. AND4]
MLAEIYQEEVNITVWQRQFDQALVEATNQFISSNPSFNKSLDVSPENTYEALQYATDGSTPEILLRNIADLVDMFCYLFELKSAGLRLATLTSPMCPRFHVDQVPCRLVTTYHGTATQWLTNDTIDRSKLGRGSNGMSDAESGLYKQDSDIQRLSVGDVALLKGERWIGNENKGLVHRSPHLSSDETRLLLTLDFG